ALYFTYFTAAFSGRTPGKWFFGMRVVQLDGQPLTWWRSFERFGGYAAGLATGLLGFAQVLWDRNRQGIQDKIAETVVLRTGGRWKLW
ncbi:MAG: RDD family protein, partial [Acidobacteriota bacterium]